MSANRIRVLLVSLLAVFAIGAVASATASAHEFSVPCHKVIAANKGLGEWEDAACTKAGGTKEFTTKLLAGETEEFLDTSGPAILVAPAVAIEIECWEDTSKGKLEAAGKTTGEATFYRCRVVTPAGCKVKEPIEIKFTDLLVGAATEPVKDEFKGTEAEETFVTITIEGCAAEGKFKVKGTQIADLPAAGQERALHEIISTPSGSKLKLGANAAFFTNTETVRLFSGKLWDAI
jgi:hypothetical protein